MLGPPPVLGLHAPFIVTDALRRAQAEILGVLGFGPDECAFRVVGTGSGWRLREYEGGHGPVSLLIVSSPIKRPYLWDLSPSASAIRNCLGRGLHVYLLEWLPATRAACTHGLDEHVEAIARCVATTSASAGGAPSKPFVVGHSLGGTLAAIFASLAWESIGGLVLLGAPLCFAPGTSSFRDGLVSLVPRDLPDADPFPGSLVSHASALAAPATFVWSRLWDAALSVGDPRALELHARVERWTLDEVPLPGRLFRQLVDWLYREDRLCRGTLTVGGRIAGASTLSAPTLAVMNRMDDIAPPASLETFVAAMPAGRAQLIDYAGELGVCLQHLGILIGPRARQCVWPEIFAWLEARTGT